MFWVKKRAQPPPPVTGTAVRFDGIVSSEIERLVLPTGATIKRKADGRLKIYQGGNTEYVSVGDYVVVTNDYVKSYSATQFAKQFGEQEERSNVETDSHYEDAGTVSASKDWYSNMRERFGMKNQIINAASCVLTGAASVGVCLAPVDLYVKVMVIGVCAFAVIWTTLNAAIGKSR